MFFIKENNIHFSKILIKLKIITKIQVIIFYPLRISYRIGFFYLMGLIGIFHPKSKFIM